MAVSHRTQSRRLEHRALAILSFLALLGSSAWLPAACSAQVPNAPPASSSTRSAEGSQAGSVVGDDAPAQQVPKDPGRAAAGRLDPPEQRNHRRQKKRPPRPGAGRARPHGQHAALGRHDRQRNHRPRPRCSHRRHSRRRPEPRPPRSPRLCAGCSTTSSPRSHSPPHSPCGSSTTPPAKTSCSPSPEGERSASPGLMGGAKHTISKDLHHPSTLALIGVEQGAGFLGPFGIGVGAYEYLHKNGGDASRVQAIDAPGPQPHRTHPQGAHRRPHRQRSRRSHCRRQGARPVPRPRSLGRRRQALRRLEAARQAHRRRLVPHQHRRSPAQPQSRPEAVSATQTGKKAHLARSRT